MDQTTFSRQNSSPAYDFRVYDRVWQRVAPGTDPFSDDPAVAGMTANAPEPAAPVAAAETATVPATAQQVRNEATLPGAEQNPCCMGTAANESIEVLEGFVQEELAESGYCQALACRVRNQQIAQMLFRAAAEKKNAARELCAAYFLITGTKFSPTVTVEQISCENLLQSLRSFYHQEVCNGLNYQRAADETIDVCLTKLLNRLGEQAYQRAECLLAMLGKFVCC